MGFKMVAMTFRLVVGVVCVTWRRGSSAHWGWGSSSRWILCGSSSDARSCCCRGNRPSALWSHHLETHRKSLSPERARTHTPGCTAAVAMVTCCEGPPTPRTGPASPAGAWGIGAPAGTPRPAARPTPGPPATPANGTRAIPVYMGGQRERGGGDEDHRGRLILNH